MVELVDPGSELGKQLMAMSLQELLAFLDELPAAARAMVTYADGPDQR